MWQPQSFLEAIVSCGIFGLIGLFLMIFGFKLFDWITPGIKVEHELAEKHNVAVGIVIAGVIVGTSIIVAAAIHG